MKQTAGAKSSRKRREENRKALRNPVIRPNARDKEVHAGPCHRCSLAKACSSDKISCEGYRYFLRTEESKFDALYCHKNRGLDFKPLPPPGEDDNENVRDV